MTHSAAWPDSRSAGAMAQWQRVRLVVCGRLKVQVLLVLCACPFLPPDPLLGNCKYTRGLERWAMIRSRTTHEMAESETRPCGKGDPRTGTPASAHPTVDLHVSLHSLLNDWPRKVRTVSVPLGHSNGPTKRKGQELRKRDARNGDPSSHRHWEGAWM